MPLESSVEEAVVDSDDVQGREPLSGPLEGDPRGGGSTSFHAIPSHSTVLLLDRATSAEEWLVAGLVASSDSLPGLDVTEGGFSSSARGEGARLTSSLESCARRGRVASDLSVEPESESFAGVRLIC